MRLGTLGYRSLRSLYASLAAFHFKIRTSVNADALAHALGAGRSSKTYSPSTIPENRKRIFCRLPARPERPLGASVFKYDLHFNMKHRQRGA